MRKRGRAPHTPTPNCCEHSLEAEPREHYRYLSGLRRGARGLRRPPPLPSHPEPLHLAAPRCASPQPGHGPRWRLRCGHMSPSTAAAAVRLSVRLSVCLAAPSRRSPPSFPVYWAAAEATRPRPKWRRAGCEPTPPPPPAPRAGPPPNGRPSTAAPGRWGRWAGREGGAEWRFRR